MNSKNSKKKRIIVIVILILLMLGIALTFFFLHKGGGPITNPFKMDNNASEIQNATTDQAAIQQALNEKVDKNSICISMAPQVTFQNGTSEGQLDILNDPSNNYLMVVEIIRSDTNETIYKTDAIAVGKGIAKDKLDVSLSAGKYNCVAYFNAYTPDTHEFVGKAGENISITVLK